MAANRENTHELNSLQDVKAPALPAWHRPEMSRISVEMTLIGSGSPNDGSTGSS
jgi:hypothetical protein